MLNVPSPGMRPLNATNSKIQISKGVPNYSPAAPRTDEPEPPPEAQLPESAVNAPEFNNDQEWYGGGPPHGMGDPNSDDPNNYPPDFYQEQSMYQQLPHQQYQYHQHQMHMMFANTYQNFMHMYNLNTPYGYHPHNNPRNRNNRNQGRGKKGKRRMKKRRDDNWRKNASAPDANKKPSVNTSKDPDSRQETKSKPFSFSINATEFVPAAAQISEDPAPQPEPEPTPPNPPPEPQKTGIWAQMVMNNDNTGKKKQVGRVGRSGNARPTSADSSKSFQSVPPMKMSSTSPNRVHPQSASSSPIEPPPHYPPHSQPPKG